MSQGNIVTPQSSSSDTDTDVNTLESQMNDLTNALLTIGSQEHRGGQREGSTTKKKPGRPKKLQPKQNQSPDSLTKQIMTLTEQVTLLTQKFGEMQSMFNGLFEKMKLDNEKLKTENTALRSEIISVNHRVDDMEQEANNGKIVLHIKNYQNNHNVNVKTYVSETLNRRINLDPSFLDGVTVNKFGKFNDKFILEVSSMSMKSFLFKVIKEKKPRDIFVNEFLTRKRSQLFYEIRQKKKNDPRLFHSVYTYNGSIFLKHTKESQPIRIYDIDDLKFTTTHG